MPASSLAEILDGAYPQYKMSAVEMLSIAEGDTLVDKHDYRWLVQEVRRDDLMLYCDQHWNGMKTMIDYCKWIDVRLKYSKLYERSTDDNPRT